MSCRFPDWRSRKPGQSRFLPIQLRKPRLSRCCGIVLLGLVAGCAAEQHTPEASPPAAPGLPALESGFLTNYSRLQPSKQSPSVLFYRDENLKHGFRKILFRPVQVWRGADRRLDDIPESDLQYLADSFY